MTEEIPPDTFRLAMLAITSFQRSGHVNGTGQELQIVGDYFGKVYAGASPGKYASQWVEGAERVYRTVPGTQTELRELAGKLEQVCHNPQEHTQELEETAEFLRYFTSN